MATSQLDLVIQHLCQTILESDQWMTDGQLMESFIARKDENAFQALVRRHGPMVLAVCRRLLRNHHDAEDAFQAVFLVLARKAQIQDEAVGWVASAHHPHYHPQPHEPGKRPPSLLQRVASKMEPT